MKWLRRAISEVFWIAISVAVVGGGVLGFRLLGATAPVVGPTEIERPTASVETIPLLRWSDPLPVRGTGFISPFRSLALSSEISGRIVDLHPALENGGTFQAGALLVRLDDSAARATLAQSQANLSASEARLTLTRTQLTRVQTLRARGVVAQDALDQLLSQEAELLSSLESLAAAREAAEIALRQTLIHAPFAGRVETRRAELGAVVSAGQVIADIYTDDTLEVTVALREEEAAWIPGLFADGRARASITSRFAGRNLVWQGQVDRVDGGLDASSRALDVTVRLIDVTAQIEAGMGLASGAPPALINAFAEVMIEGASMEGLYVVPSTAIYHSGSQVRLASEGTLTLTPASVVMVDGAQSFVALTHIPPDARLIVSPLDLAIDGMPVFDLSLETAALAAQQE